MKYVGYGALALAACAGSKDPPAGPGTSGRLPDGGLGTGSIEGGAADAAFTSAATTLWLGAPDSAATTVVYVFSNRIQCSELASAGWDTRIRDKTQILEIKMFGVTPQTYAAVATMTPAPGEASVNYTLSSTTGVPIEQFGNGGTVTLAALNAQSDATGAFDLHFGSSALSGTFDAAFCPGGHEP